MAPDSSAPRPPSLVVTFPSSALPFPALLCRRPPRVRRSPTQPRKRSSPPHYWFPSSLFSMEVPCVHHGHSKEGHWRDTSLVIDRVEKDVVSLCPSFRDVLVAKKNVVDTVAPSSKIVMPEGSLRVKSSGQQVWCPIFRQKCSESVDANNGWRLVEFRRAGRFRLNVEHASAR